MRDQHGRYQDTKTIVDNGPLWARGCALCTNGLVGAPPLRGVDTVSMERLAQAMLHELTFCTCQAGTRYHSCLLNREQELKDYERKAGMVQGATIKRTMDAVLKAMPVPTMHFQEREVVR